MVEEYEVIPTSPIRRLEKRIAKMETTTASSEVRKLIEQIIELIKSNQRIIDDLVKSDFELRSEIAKIPGKIDQLLTKMSEFMELLKASATEEVAGVSKESTGPLVKKIEELIEQNKKNSEVTQTMLSTLEAMEKRRRRTPTAGAYAR